MSRKKIAAANWKMNLSIAEGISLVQQIMVGLPALDGCEVVIAPPLTHLGVIGQELSGSGIGLCAQHCYFEPAGAFTGEVSVAMVRAAGAQYVITGHSERRQIFDESNEMIKAKVNAILHGGLTPIFCCGEALELRESGAHMAFVQRQLEESIFHLTKEEMLRMVIAYEPIWAIGTGVTASPGQAEEMHAFLRGLLMEKYDHDVADAVRILYGGSIKADNARTIFSQPNVDGGLVGGASLQASGFLEIIRAACG